MKLFKKNVTKLEIPMELSDSSQGPQDTSLQVWKALIQEFNNIWSQKWPGKRYTKFSLCCYDSCLGSTSWPVYC